MEGIEGFMKSFGFTQEPLIIIIICALALLGSNEFTYID